MVPNVKALILAEGASLDALSGRLTAFNMLEEVAAPRFPAFLPKLAIIILYERAAAGKSLSIYERVSVLSPAGVEILHAETALSLQQRFHRSIHIVAFGLESDGAYRIRVEGFRDAEHTRPFAGLHAERDLVATLRPEPQLPGIQEPTLQREPQRATTRGRRAARRSGLQSSTGDGKRTS